MPDEPMTIRYQNTFRDMMAFCFYHYPRSPLVVGAFGVCFLLISLTIYQALPKEANPLVKSIAFLTMEALCFGFFAALFVGTTVLSMVSRRNKTFLTEHTIVLGQEGFTSETPYSRSESKWLVVQKLARTSNHIFIYVSQHAAHVVPRRAFQSASDWDSFYQFCRQRTQPSNLNPA